jgi:hypothetical protein
MTMRKLNLRQALSAAFGAARKEADLNDTDRSGYPGGYMQAISDVLHAMHDMQPSKSRYWPKDTP